nr:hypothetical protein Iba_chr10aCG3210 [Ipomoea batatas]
MMASGKSIAVVLMMVMMAFAVCCNSLPVDVFLHKLKDVSNAESETAANKDPKSLIRSRLLLEVHEKCPCWPACCWDKVDHKNN